MKHVNTKEVLAFMIKESLKSKRFIVGVCLMPIGSLVMSTAIPFITSNLLAKLARGNIGDQWKFSLLLFVIAGCLGFISNRVGILQLLGSQIESLERIQNTVMEKLLQKSSEFYANRMAGKIISDGIALSSAFIQFQDLMVVKVIPFTLTLCAGLTIVFIKSWQLGLGLTIISLVIILAAIRSSKRRSVRRHERHVFQRELHGRFADVITNNQNVKVFARELEERKEFAELGVKLSEKRDSDWTEVGKNGSNRIATIFSLQALFIILVVHLISRDPGLLATGIFAFSFTLTLSNRLFEIGNMVMMYENAITDSWPMIEVLAEPATIVDLPSASTLHVKKAGVAFKNVTFNYPENKDQKPLFKDLSLTIQPGEKIGLVGHSGGGKTTITKLILRLSDIQGGSILIDDQNIAEVTQKSLRDAIAYVPQEALLFHRTITENIAYGAPGASKEQVESAAKKAYAHEFIKTLPYGYDTLVGERGVKLSGGQRQRVAIARAILKDAPILVLDEATSALDSESEVLIQKALWKLMEGRTAIVIAHRLSTIQKMDRIIVLDNGKIAEEGSHAELLKNKGKYAELWAHQSGGFMED